MSGSRWLTLTFSVFALSAFGSCHVFPRQTSYANSSYTTTTLSSSSSSTSSQPVFSSSFDLSYTESSALSSTSSILKSAISSSSSLAISSTSIASSTLSISLKAAPPLTTAPPSTGIPTNASSSSLNCGEGGPDTCYYCDSILADFIGLNSWYSTNYPVTVATVIQNYIQYNNTVIPGNATTITKAAVNASTLYGTYDRFGAVPTLTGVPTTLAVGPGDVDDYAKTIIAPGDIANLGSNVTHFASPTAWYAGPGLYTFEYTMVMDGQTSSNIAVAFSPTVTNLFYSTDVPSEGWSGTTRQTMPTELKEAVIAANPTLYNGFPLSACTGTWYMGGEPTVHVAVDTLTVTSGSTSTTNALLSNPSSSTTSQLVPSTSVGDDAPTLSPATKTSQTTLQQPTSESVSAILVNPTSTSLTSTIPAQSATLPQPSSEQATATSTTNPGGAIISIIAGASTSTDQAQQTQGGGVSVSASKDQQTQDGGSGSASTSTGGFKQDTTSPVAEDSGNTVSIAPSATVVVVNGNTTPINTPATQATTTPVAAVITVGSSTVTANSNSQFVVGTQTVSAGGSAITAGGSTISIVASGTAVVVNGNTTPIQAASTTSSATAVITVGSSVITANSASQFVVGSQTLSAGGSAIIVSGSTISIATSGTDVVINGNTTPIQSAQNTSAAGIINVGLSTVTANSASQFVVGSQTISAGGSAITVSGSTISIASGGNSVVINGQTSPVAKAGSTAAAPAPVITVGSSTIAENSASQFIVGSQTLSAGGSAITVSGSTISLAAGGSSIVINGQTSAIATPVAAPVTIGTGSNVAVATPVSSGAYVLPGGQTLSEGSSTVIAGTTFVNSPSGILSVNGQPIATATPAAVVAASIPGATQSSVSELIIGGSTLLPGQSATISGTTYALASTGGSVLVNGKPTALPSAAPGSPITLGEVVATPTIAPDYVISGSTLLPGGSALTISGTTYYLVAGGSSLVVNGHTSPIASGQASVTLGTSVAGVTPTLISDTTEFIVDGQTLRPGSEITISGETLTVAPGGSAILVESGGSTSTDDLAGAIMSAMGVSSRQSTSMSTPVSTASGSRISGAAVPKSTTSRAGAEQIVGNAGVGVGALIAFAAWL